MLFGCTIMSDISARAAAGPKKPVRSAHPSTTAPGRQPTVVARAKARDTRLPVAVGETVDVNGARRAFRFSQAQHSADSATRITAEELTNRNVVTIADLQQLLPNVTIQSMNGTSTINYLLRGVGMNDYTQNAMSSVMTYIDGVAFPLGQMSNGMMFDLASVDVTPGPVGTEHGQTDTGGEINIHTADPTATWHGGLSEDIASYARNRTNFHVSGPLSRTVSFRIAGQAQQGGGWQSMPLDGSHLGDANEGALRAKLRWQPDEKTDIMLTGHWVQDDSQVVTGKPFLNVQPVGPSPNMGFYQAEWDLRPQFAALFGRSASIKPSEHNTFWGADLKMSRQLGFATLSSISAFETERIGEYTDQDATQYATGDQYRNVVSNTFSQELSLKSAHQQSPFHWSIGAYYDRVRMAQQFFMDFTQYLPQRGYLSETSYQQNQQTFSQFAHLSYRFPHNVTLFGGITHEADDRQLLGLATRHFGISTLNFNNEATSANQFSGVVGVQWQPVSNLMAYFKVSKGFKPGGFTANNTVIQAQLAPYKPETLLAYEVGFKSDIVPNVFRLNGAAFYYDYHDQQVLTTLLVPNYGPLGMFMNAPKSQIWGIELNTEIHPFRHIFLSGNLGYQRGNYQIYQTLNTTAVAAYAQTHGGVWQAFYTDYSGTDTGMPKLSMSGTAEYRFNPLNGYEWVTAVDGSYRGAQAMSPGVTSGMFLMPSYFLLGAHMTFRPASGRWSVTAYASNILQRHYEVSAGMETTTYYYMPSPPRFIGGRFGFNF
ncbi:TonB-dependent receptor plug domain-containing protein [Gluconacetobacter aggeris]|uniref:TonB-dependent receptor plug domain-containing protein n=2 Tax=Gluconacetobacter aggeris TaxID=1286186 RepID=A0A7W4IPX8_9PROT|nr:TonB-dependent receptor plug domain-containing protein [Gluconacetobacter aggeris]